MKDILLPPWESGRERKEFLMMSLSIFPVNIIGSMGYVVIALYAYSLLPNYSYLGLVIATPVVVSVVMNYLWGALSDASGLRVRLIIIGGVVTACIYPLMWFPDPALFLVLRLVQSVFSTSGSLISAVATEQFPLHKSRALGDLGLSSSAGAILGGFTVGFLIPKELISPGSSAILYFFIFSMGLQLISLIPLRFIDEKGITKKRKDNGGDSQPLPGNIYYLMTIIGFSVFGTMVAGSLMPVYIANILGRSTAEVGIVASTASIGGLIAAPIAGYAAERFNKKRVILAAIASYIFIWGTWSMTTEIVILALLWSIPVFSFLYIPSCALVAEWTPSSTRGKGLGLISSSVGVSQVIGAVTGGALTQYLGGGFDAFIFTFRFSLIFILIGLILAALFLPSKIATPDKKGNEP